jgi:hypothetical protein
LLATVAVAMFLSVATPADAGVRARGTPAMPRPTPTTTTPPGPTTLPPGAIEIRLLSVGLASGAAPLSIVDAFGSMWITAHRYGVMFRIDPQTNAVEAVFPPRAQCGPLTASAELLWFTACQQGPLVSLGIDPATGSVVRELPPGSVVTGGSMWTNDANTALVRRDPESDDELARVPLSIPPNPDGQLPGSECAGPLWTVNGIDQVQRTDLATNTTLVIKLKRPRGTYEPLSTGAGCAAGKVWVPNAAGLFQIDPATNRVRRFPLAIKPPSFFFDVSIASDGDDVYVRTGDATVVRIDGDTGNAVRTYSASRFGWGGGIAVAYDSLWVVNTLDGTVWRHPL